MVIGRSLANDNETPRFDLSPYNAQEKGVSRRHVILKRTPNSIVLEDMGSSNGTWVNGTLVLPFAPTPLQSGDHLRLGQFIMRIYLP
jgi:pSer/pThr/pTyr-binding forkhead associated (FHA) protein